MNILDAFPEEMNQIIEIYSIKKGYNPLNSQTTSTTKLEKKVQAGYWTGSSAEQLVSERFRTQVDGVVVIKPNDLEGYSINDSDKMVISGSEYNVIYSDDVMFLNEVLIVGVKRV